MEQGSYILNFDQGIILVDGRKVQTYTELVELTAQDKYKNTNYIDVIVLSTIAGG
jgi:hypothetical protein